MPRQKKEGGRWSVRRAQKLGAERDGNNVVMDLAEGRSVEWVAEQHRRQPGAVEGVRTFYSMLEGQKAACAGTTCRFEVGPVSHDEGQHPTYCHGRCFAPEGNQETPIPRRSIVDSPVVLRHLLGDDGALGDYNLQTTDPETILTRIAEADLRGRGGAAFPTALKWRAARNTAASKRYVVVNADEGDPGSFVDRLLILETPHAVLAGMKACALAIGASEGIVFIRGEYPLAQAAVERAIVQATEAGLLGEFTVRVFVGAGSYVSGEESAMLRSIEGLRSEPTPKPPFPAESGLYGYPTVVQNVETIASVPAILAGASAQTKAFCVSGAVKTPAVVEAKLGATLREVLEDGGDGEIEGRPWKMALVGGPMGRLLPVEKFDQPLSFKAYPGMGHGGIVVFDTSVSASDLADHLYEFAEAESCGSCAPCRLGCAQLRHAKSPADLEKIMDVMELGSLCAFGKLVPAPIRDLIEHYPEELFA